MNFTKIAKVLELAHYKRVILFFFKHPIKFVRRLSMFMKLSIGWTVVSTVFGFVVFGLVVKDLVIEKSKNAHLQSEFQNVQKDLTTLKNSEAYKVGTDLEKDFKESNRILNDSIVVYSRIIELPTNHKKLPDFKKRLQYVLSTLSSKNNSEASITLKKLSEDVAKERIAQSL